MTTNCPKGRTTNQLNPTSRRSSKVCHSNFTLEPNAIKKVPVSEKCALEVKSSGNSSVEVALFGKGKEAARQKQPLPKDETLVVSGNAPNSTAWLVVLKRLE